MLKQVAKLTAVSLKSLRNRLGTSSLIVVGIGGVVAVLVALLAMAQGFRAALADTGRPDRAIVLRTGAADEVSSWLTSDEVAIISELPGVTLASGELFVVADLVTRKTGRPGVAIARGLTPAGFALRPELEIVRGRNLEPGHDELIAGVDAVAAYQGLEIGDKVNVRNHVWTVVGHFRGVGAQDSEVWVDLPVAQAAFRREGAVCSVRLLLDDETASADAAREIRNDPRLTAELIPEPAFYRAQSEGRARLIESFAYLVSVIMAVGAFIAAYSTMHAAVSIRKVEIATLRALGFGSGPIVISVLIEAMLLALLGGLIGGGLVYLLYDGYAASTLSSSSLSQVAFRFAVTPGLIGVGLAGALILGLLGGIVPALGAARTGVVEGLRET
ncbi:MAG: ABC transporter permease [Pseudomonadales bacterium]|jgi:putative ABC transport system permease protein